jgi:tetratricopeptide (TPR) repeat protein
MDVERRRQIEEVYRAARKQEAEHVSVFLAAACGDDQELRSEVEALLNQPLWDAMTASPNEALSGARPGAVAAASARFLPSNIGRYRILRLLGEGGMGVVYEAEQEHPRRTVALKIIKPGLVSAEVLRRFEHESLALGRLQHPGIAQIYDAGTAETGFGPQPYFAMEFIRGRSLLEYADQEQLNTGERLELMVRICEAVQHAHQRGLIHRDLKPGNILVDEAGQPKILDFGVARATDSDAHATRQTDLGQLVGTLAYMSPEQVLGDPLELDTRSDVYSLGVSLYELLAACLPYRISQKLHEAVQVIKEEDPVPLGSINRVYRGDLETIVFKALEKAKARRYASAAELAADIRRYLADEPIQARPASTAYQLRKFARRHKAWVAGVGAVFVVLVAGIAVSAWQARLAIQERNRAVAEKQRADIESATAKAVNDFLQKDLLAQASANAQARPDSRPDPDLKVRTALDRAAARITGKFDFQPLVEASIRTTIASTYSDLGLFAEAQPQLERTLDLRRRVLGENHPDTLGTMGGLAELYLNQGRYEDAERTFSKVLESRRRVLGGDHADTVRAMNNLAMLYLNQGKYAQSEPLFTKVVEAQRRTLGEEHPDTLTGISNLGLLYLLQGKNADAEPLWTKVLEVRRRVLGEEHPDTLVSMNNLGGFYREQCNYTEAEPLFTKVLEARRRVLGNEHPDTLRSMSNLAGLYRDEGKYALAEPLWTKVLEVRRRTLGEKHPDTLISLNNVALLHLYKGQYALAETLFVRVLDGRRRLLGLEHPATASVLASLGTVRLREHKYADAEPLLREALSVQDKKTPSSWERYNSQYMLGSSLTGQRKYAEAEPLLLSAYEGLVQRRDTIPWNSRPVLGEAGQRIVQLYRDWSKPERAAAWSEKLRANVTSASQHP